MISKLIIWINAYVLISIRFSNHSSFGLLLSIYSNPFFKNEYYSLIVLSLSNTLNITTHPSISALSESKQIWYKLILSLPLVRSGQVSMLKLSSQILQVSHNISDTNLLIEEHKVNIHDQNYQNWHEKRSVKKILIDQCASFPLKLTNPDLNIHFWGDLECPPNG